MHAQIIGLFLASSLKKESVINAMADTIVERVSVKAEIPRPRDRSTAEREEN